jgi:alkaline phosphatase
MSINSMSKAACVVGAVAVLVLAGCGSDKQESIGDPLSRAAKGKLSANGGAARLGGNQTDTIRNAISSSGARNVILLIGDGMGDSEITIARNYQKGAGGFFGGIDALPLTGSYTT